MLIFSSMYRPAPNLTPLFIFPALVFEALVRARNGLYSAGMLAQRRLPRPVISIGNITLGGTGKTPLVLYVAQILSSLGATPAVLSRGYGRLSPKSSHILSPESHVFSPALNLGDEAALMRRHLPLMWMGISQNRYAAGRDLLQLLSRAIFILDDGFQYRRLHRDLDIVIIDPSQPLESNHLFPRGTLREPISGLRRCQVAVINGLPTAKSSALAEMVIRRYQPNGIIFYCEQKIASLVSFSDWRNSAKRRHDNQTVKSAYLVAALGNPERFQRDIQRLGIEVRGTRFFRDHFKLRPRDWHACIDEARRQTADAIITTEKDAIKITQPPDFPLLISIQSTEMPQSAEFKFALKKIVEGSL